MHATHTLYYSVVPEPVLVAEAATQRAVKAAENLSAGLVEVANTGAAKVSLELRVVTVRPPVVARQISTLCIGVPRAAANRR